MGPIHPVWGHVLVSFGLSRSYFSFKRDVTEGCQQGKFAHQNVHYVFTSDHIGDFLLESCSVLRLKLSINSSGTFPFLYTKDQKTHNAWWTTNQHFNVAKTPIAIAATTK